jgi:hypothetical protein
MQDQTISVKNQKYECGGQLNVKIHILLHGHNYEVCTQIKFGTVKDCGHTYLFYLNYYYFVSQSF